MSEQMYAVDVKGFITVGTKGELIDFLKDDLENLNGEIVIRKVDQDEQE